MFSQSNFEERGNEKVEYNTSFHSLKKTIQTQLVENKTLHENFI